MSKEFVLVDVPSIFPGKCLCGSQQRPILDTFWNLDMGRVYICKTCAERISRAFGFMESEELERLRDARSLLDQAEKEIKERDVMLRDHEAQLLHYERLESELKDELAHQKGKVAQLSSALDRVRTDAIAQVEAVTESYTHDEFA